MEVRSLPPEPEHSVGSRQTLGSSLDPQEHLSLHHEAAGFHEQQVEQACEPRCSRRRDPVAATSLVAPSRGTRRRSTPNARPRSGTRHPFGSMILAASSGGSVPAASHRATSRLGTAAGSRSRCACRDRRGSRSSRTCTPHLDRSPSERATAISRSGVRRSSRHASRRYPPSREVRHREASSRPLRVSPPTSGRSGGRTRDSWRRPPLRPAPPHRSRVLVHRSSIPLACRSLQPSSQRSRSVRAHVSWSARLRP